MNDQSETSALRRHAARPRGGVADLLGHRLTACDEAAGTARAGFTAQAPFCNPLQQVQGGFMAAMLEQVMLDAAHCTAGIEAVVTALELQVQFLRPGRPGEIFGEAEVLHGGRSTAFLQGRLRDGDGNILVSGDAVARFLHPPANRSEA